MNDRVEHRQARVGDASGAQLCRDGSGDPVGLPHWHVLWTRSNCELLVHDQLSAKGFELFLPRIDRWSEEAHQKRLGSVPMFPGYLFIHNVMDKDNYLEVSKARGLVRILGSRWDRLAVVPDREIDAVKKAVGAQLPTMPHPYLQEGQRVRITRGPLENVCGILVKFAPTTGLLVLSVELLRRSLAVQIDCTLVAPA